MQPSATTTMQTNAADLPAGARDLHRMRRWVVDQLHALLEPVLHPSPWRIRAIGLVMLFGHPLFYFIWSTWLPQPYESVPLRVFMALLGLGLLVLPGVSADPPSRPGAILYSLVLWASLPAFFTWMYLCNDGNTVWLASTGAMLLIYYHLTDWRLASIGSLSGAAFAWMLYGVIGPDGAPIAGEQAATNAVVLGFCAAMGIVLGLSSANLRREHLAHTLTTIGIMAHELRTPLATAHLIAETLRQTGPEVDLQRLRRLACRLENVVRSMNHQIDTEIANARLTRLAPGRDRIAAGDLVRAAIESYPFRTPRERGMVAVTIRQDFEFIGCSHLFAQVVVNLTKNALRALAASPVEPRRLEIEIAATAASGVIRFADNGVGISPEVKARLFQPFVSTARGAGHGLGLAFCVRVVRSARGSIRVESAPGEGAAFLIELPKA